MTGFWCLGFSLFFFFFFTVWESCIFKGLGFRGLRMKGSLSVFDSGSLRVQDSVLFRV